METKKCPYCSEEIQKTAKVCKHCWTDIKKKQKEESLKRRNKKAFWLLAIMVIVLFWYAGMSSEPTSHTSSWYQDCLFTDRAIVERNLKSPSTAEFVSCYKEWSMIKGTVDSENGFWAMIRSSFTCNWDECVIY